MGIKGGRFGVLQFSLLLTVSAPAFADSQALDGFRQLFPQPNVDSENKLIPVVGESIVKEAQRDRRKRELEALLIKSGMNSQQAEALLKKAEGQSWLESLLNLPPGESLNSAQLEAAQAGLSTLAHEAGMSSVPSLTQIDKALSSAPSTQNLASTSSASLFDDSRPTFAPRVSYEPSAPIGSPGAPLGAAPSAPAYVSRNSVYTAPSESVPTPAAAAPSMPTESPATPPASKTNDTKASSQSVVSTSKPTAPKATHSSDTSQTSSNTNNYRPIQVASAPAAAPSAPKASAANAGSSTRGGRGGDEAGEESAPSEGSSVREGFGASMSDLNKPSWFMRVLGKRGDEHYAYPPSPNLNGTSLSATPEARADGVNCNRFDGNKLNEMNNILHQLWDLGHDARKATTDEKGRKLAQAPIADFIAPTVPKDCNNKSQADSSTRMHVDGLRCWLRGNRPTWAINEKDIQAYHDQPGREKEDLEAAEADLQTYKDLQRKSGLLAFKTNLTYPSQKDEQDALNFARYELVACDKKGFQAPGNPARELLLKAMNPPAPLSNDALQRLNERYCNILRRRMQMYAGSQYVTKPTLHRTFTVEIFRESFYCTNQGQAVMDLERAMRPVAQSCNLPEANLMSTWAANTQGKTSRQREAAYNSTLHKQLLDWELKNDKPDAPAAPRDPSPDSKNNLNLLLGHYRDNQALQGRLSTCKDIDKIYSGLIQIVTSQYFRALGNGEAYDSPSHSTAPTWRPSRPGH